MYNEKITKEDLNHKSDEEKIAYAYSILETIDDYVYGQIINGTKNVFEIKPYNVFKEQAATLFLGEIRCTIKLGKEDGLNIGDYIKGRLTIHHRDNGWFYYLIDIQKLKTKAVFEEELQENLEKKWKSDGFIFDKKDIVEFNWEKLFSTWMPNKVEAMLEERYKAFIQKRKDEIDQLEKNIEAKQKEMDEAEKLYNYYKEIGLINENLHKLPESSFYPYTDYNSLIEQVWRYLWIEEDLQYEKFTVSAFMNALRTKQLILLWGRPGTGKTSLPVKTAKALGAKIVRIQVQSNWTDNQDLLGFYNVVDKHYVSTQFLDALIEAEKNPKQLYIILLDEMNLSNVEYYFSEMLNAFTWDKPYEITLYPKMFREKDIDCHYKPVITISENVKFVGTLNTDATTKIISPKVIDRSCLIELQTISETVKTKEAKDLPEKNPDGFGNMVVRPDIFAVIINNENNNDRVLELLSKIEEIRKLGLPISNRLNMYIKQWTYKSDTYVTLDEIVLEKVLPAIDFEYNNKTKEIIQALKQSLQDCEKSLNKIERMEEQAKATDRFRYWED